MVNTKFNFYFFGDIGEYDNYNPANVCNKEYTSEILYLIAKNEPFSLNECEIAKFLDIKEDVVTSVINNLELINAIEVKNNTYRIKFPAFLQKDVIEMESYIDNIGEIIGKKIMQMKDLLYKKVLELKCSKYHSCDRILYHIICDRIFDGTAFEFFTERNIFCSSKIQPGNRDYIIVAYEDSDLVEKYSNMILCSSNNYRSSGFTFNSFGDSNGQRKDMFKFFRLTQKSVNNASQFDDINISYNKILDNMNKEMVFKCGMLICNIINQNIKYNQLSAKDKNLAQFLEKLEYISINTNDDSISVAVPIFYDFEIDTVIKNLSDIILINIFQIVKEVFENFEINALKLTSIKHNVDIKEIANELWHQIFGSTNEYLVREGFVSTPDSINGQGRYLKSLTIPLN